MAQRMEIVNLEIIESFKRQHNGSRKPLEDWASKALSANWSSPHDIKKMFSTVSFVKQFVIFNIGGNKYRLLTKIAYELKRVRILKIGTHEAYNSWKL
jgi:mRNA interferase HigB